MNKPAKKNDGFFDKIFAKNDNKSKVPDVKKIDDRKKKWNPNEVKTTFTNKPNLGGVGAAQAPRPNVDDCPNRGVWSQDLETNKKMIAVCQACAGSIGSYGERLFYCNGECMSEYNPRQVCSTTSLVATEAKQCENPCYQTRAPDLSSKNSGSSLSGSGIRAPGGNTSFLVPKEGYTNLNPFAQYKSPPNGSQWIGIL